MSYRLDDLYPDWQRDARCSGVGTDYYFGAEQTTSSTPTMSFMQVRQASKLCDVCPVFYDCLSWALENREEYGVWAGTSGRVRRDIFFLIDRDLVTVDDVIERYRDGRESSLRELRAAHRVDSGRRGRPDLRHAPGGEVASGDR